MYYIGLSWEESLFQKVLLQESGILFSRTWIPFGKQWSREFFWKDCLIANLRERITISETKFEEFFFSRTRILFGRQLRRKFFWKKCLFANHEKNRNFRSHKIRGRIFVKRIWILTVKILLNKPFLSVTLVIIHIHIWCSCASWQRWSRYLNVSLGKRKMMS